MIAQEPLTNTEEKLLITPEEAARKCSVCRTTLYAWIREEGLPSLRVGKRRLICPDQLREWIQRRHEEQASR